MKYRMEQLINRSYKAIQDRGLINEDTNHMDFFDKINEEHLEFVESYHCESKEKEIAELLDFITAGIMYLHYLGQDFIKEFEKVVIKNEKRARSKR